MSYTLADLPYAYDALEPHFDTLTMQIHHGKHHAAYVNNLNAAVKDTPNEGKPLESLLANISSLSPAIRNNGGGHWNHTFFWESLTGSSSGAPSGKLAEAINQELGGFEAFKEAFAKAGISRFGSGWAWLCVDANKKLCICSTPNQDNPLMDVAECKGTPILGLDVWEHAYYLKYQNRRPDFIAAFWNVIDWEVVNNRYLNAL